MSEDLEQQIEELKAKNLRLAQQISENAQSTRLRRRQLQTEIRELLDEYLTKHGYTTPWWQTDFIDELIAAAEEAQ